MCSSDLLLAAYRAAAGDGFEGTDTAACFAAYAGTVAPGARVVAVPSSPLNLKVTFPEDVAVAEALLDAPGAPRRPPATPEAAPSATP